MARRTELRTHYLDELLKLLDRPRTRVWLAAPYVGHEVAGSIADAIGRWQPRSRELRLLTHLDSTAVARGALSASGLLDLHHAGFRLRSVENLHAKVAIVDRAWAIVGSGNLTEPGANGKNIELGLRLTGPLLAAAADEFEGWWRSAQGKTLAPRDLHEAEKLALRAGARQPAGRSWGGRLKMPSGQRLRIFVRARSSRANVIAQLREQCGSTVQARRGSLSRTFPLGRRSSGYRLCRQLADNDERSASERSKVRDTLRQVLRQHPDIDARGHAVWRLGRDVGNLTREERVKTLRALDLAMRTDPAYTVRLKAHQRLSGLGEKPPRVKPPARPQQRHAS